MLINAWTDWKRKEIDLIYTAIFLVIGVIYKLSGNGMYDWYGILPGCILLLISMIWKNQIGSGDGIIVMVFGWICGLSAVYNVLIGGFFLAACAGAVYWIQKKGKNIELPFVPFFLGSYLLDLWI